MRPLKLETIFSLVLKVYTILIHRQSSLNSSWLGSMRNSCFVAALHLGCTPRKASRSQRNINPRCYLSQDSTKLDKILSPQYQVFMKPNSFAPKTLPVMTFNNDVQVKKCPVSKYSSYPLCYSLRVPSLPVNVTDSCKSNKNSRLVSVKDATNGIAFGGCDLSLRLGPLGDDTRSPTQKRSKISSSNNNKSWKFRTENGFWLLVLENALVSSFSSSVRFRFL